MERTRQLNTPIPNSLYLRMNEVRAREDLEVRQIVPILLTLGLDAYEKDQRERLAQQSPAP